MFNPKLLPLRSSCFRSLYSGDSAHTPYGLAPGPARLGNKSPTLLNRDAAIMLYYYNTRREPVDPELHKQGWSGYTGVLQEMLDEVPTRGIGRLERKLSLDVHVLIPKFISGRQRRGKMISMAEDIARQHGCQLAPRRVPVWRRCLHGIFGLFLPIDMRKIKDEEHGVGKGVKKEERSAEGNGDGKGERKG